MATKPDKFPEWANDNPTDPVSGQSARVAPPQSKKDSGWSREEVPPRQWFNWLFWKINQWVVWFEDRVEYLLTKVAELLTRTAEVEARTETLVVDAAGDGDIDLTGTKAALIIFEGVRTGDGTVTFADDARSYFVIEDTSGDFTLSAKTETGSDTIPIERGEMIRVWSDGAEIDVSLRRATLEPDGSTFTSGSVKVTKFGKIVCVSGSMGHTAAANPNVTGFIPEWARPDISDLAFKQTVYTSGVSFVATVSVQGNGQFRIEYRDWSGSLSSQTSTGRFSLVYEKA